MKRRLLIIAICLLGGAVVNVAVVWGCAVCIQSVKTTETGLSDWPRSAPRGWPPPTTSLLLSRFGLEWEIIQANNPRRTTYTMMVYEAGWPCRSFRCDVVQTFGVPNDYWEEWRGALFIPWFDSQRRALPLNILWGGFILDTTTYMVILWLLIPGPFALRRFLRVRRGLCPKCAYPMGESSVCTECGRALPHRRPMPNPT